MGISLFLLFNILPFASPSHLKKPQHLKTPSFLEGRSLSLAQLTDNTYVD